MTSLFHPPFAGFRRRCALQCFHQQTNSLLLVLVLCCFGKPTVASAQIWTSNGPEGGYIQALAIDPTTPATVYAGTPGGGVFKSTDGGASWAAVGGLATLKTVFSLAIDPATGTVYAGTYGGGVFVLECTFARQLIVMDTSCCQMPGPASGSFEQNICVASPETRLFLDRICTFPSDSNNPCGQAGPNGCAVCWSVPYTNYCHVHDDPNNPTVCAYEFE